VYLEENGITHAMVWQCCKLQQCRKKRLLNVSSYELVKTIHITCAVLTLAGFSLRGYWMLLDSRALQHRLTRILPHIVDTLLLASAITLAVMSRQYPFVTDWVTLQVVLLLLYIVLWSLALKRGKTRNLRRNYFVAALVTIALLFWAALTEPLLPF